MTKAHGNRRKSRGDNAHRTTEWTNNNVIYKLRDEGCQQRFKVCTVSECPSALHFELKICARCLPKWTCIFTAIGPFVGFFSLVEIDNFMSKLSLKHSINMALKPFTLKFSGGKQKQLKPTQTGFFRYRQFQIVKTPRRKCFCLCSWYFFASFVVNGSFPVEINK